MNWRRDAVCRDSDTDLFFRMEDERGKAAERREEEAKAICAGCPVRAECGEWARETGQQYGIFGGLNEDERASERKNERRRMQRRGEQVA